MRGQENRVKQKQVQERRGEHHGNPHQETMRKAGPEIKQLDSIGYEEQYQPYPHEHGGPENEWLRQIMGSPSHAG